MKLKAKQPRGIIFIHYFVTEVQEGKCYTFFALDDYSEIIFDYTATLDLSEPSLLSVIVKLMENEKFQMFSHPFKLVVGFGKEIIPQMQQIAEPHNGTVLFSQKAAQKRLYPVYKQFLEMKSQ